MKKWLVMVFVFLGFCTVNPLSAVAYNFGDYRSVTLTTKAWKALEEGDIEAVLAYTNKCIELYEEQAVKMQSELTGYPEGSNEEIFKYWALNDVATCLFIQGEVFKKANMMDEAKEAYQKLIDEFSYAQAWDTKGWFWKPAEAAQERLTSMESGSEYDFGDSSSSTLAAKAWEALAANDLKAVEVYTDKCIESFSEKAKEMQSSLTEYPWESNEKIFSYWALNDVGTCYFIRGEAYRKADRFEEAKENFQTLIDEYSFAQCWDPKGWFWKPSEAAQQKIEEIEEAK